MQKAAIALIGGVLLTGTAICGDEGKDAASGKKVQRRVLVELFTSQG